ncbi:MAG: hypothetical protein AAF518_18440 [Spirochaetota bacterium]
MLEKDKKFLQDLLAKSTETEQRYLTSQEVESRLYDIQTDQGTRGRAFHIGNGFFLTAYHVIKGIKAPYYLVLQSKRGPVEDTKNASFQILHYIEKPDVALLQLKHRQRSLAGGVPLIQKAPAKNADVSLFIRLTKGNTGHSGYDLSFGGIDYYDAKQESKYLGRFLLPPASYLYEKRGLVIDYDIAKIRKKIGYFNKSKKKQDRVYIDSIFNSPQDKTLTTISAYQGESGSPVFQRIEENQYQFAGLVLAVSLVNQLIPTPKHPLGFYAHDRTITLLAHQKPIVQLLKEYINILEKKGRKK